MRALFVAVLLLGLVGCSTPKTLAPPSEGYARVRRAPAGCFGHAHEYNVVLGEGLATSLRRLVTDRALGEAQCWYERSVDTLVLVAGSECGIYDEATFRRRVADWTLVQISRELAFCDERVR
jgi:hypothetical protein